ncbi:MAG: DUF1460 domain-containing protein [Bacteroidales bacterium]|nr:DUF1460 domain-containing protein [Bacteroidales bacterium]
MKRVGITFCLAVVFVVGSAEHIVGSAEHIVGGAEHVVGSEEHVVSSAELIVGSAGRMGAIICSAERAREVQSVRFLADDLVVFEQIMTLLEPLREKPMQMRILTAAQAMLGMPYVAGTLEHTKEALTVSLAGTDCILLVEACVCMALTAAQEDRSFNAFCENLLQLRYRNGKIDGYSSRIHYTSEWILQAEALGLAKEISYYPGGIPLVQEISYMSTHAHQYTALASDPDMTKRIAHIERQLEQQMKQKGSCYVPKEHIDSALEWIQPGDMICFVTTIKGLDISHVAFAWGSGSDGLTVTTGQPVTAFLHASSTEKKVIIDKKTIKEYATGIQSCKGIRVVRFLGG